MMVMNVSSIPHSEFLQTVPVSIFLSNIKHTLDILEFRIQVDFGILQETRNPSQSVRQLSSTQHSPRQYIGLVGFY